LGWHHGVVIRPQQLIYNCWGFLLISRKVVKIMRKKLFIPGPTEVKKEVLEKMATPLIGPRTKEAAD
jgi:hypothetical protein